MVVDTDLYESTSRGSAARILCRCDKCGAEKFVLKFKLARKSGIYTQCRACFENGGQARAYIDSKCRDCGAVSKRRADALKSWSGRCTSCSSKEISNRPEVKAVLRENGKKMRPEPRRGSESNFWRGGLTVGNAKIRSSHETKVWRSNVFSRDDYTCTCCGKRGGKLEADHILPFSLHPELRFSVFNGRTVCRPCHGAYGAKVMNGREAKPARFPDNEIWRIG